MAAFTCDRRSAAIDALDRGECRVAEPADGGWRVDAQTRAKTSLNELLRGAD